MSIFNRYMLLIEASRLSGPFKCGDCLLRSRFFLAMAAGWRYAEQRRCAGPMLEFIPPLINPQAGASAGLAKVREQCGRRHAQTVRLFFTAFLIAA